MMKCNVSCIYRYMYLVQASCMWEGWHPPFHHEKIQGSFLGVGSVFWFFLYGASSSTFLFFTMASNSCSSRCTKGMWYGCLFADCGCLKVTSHHGRIALGHGDWIFGSEHPKVMTKVDEFGFYAAASLVNSSQISAFQIAWAITLPHLFSSRPGECLSLALFSLLRLSGPFWALGGWYWCWVFQRLSVNNTKLSIKKQDSWEMLAKIVHSVAASGSGNPFNDSMRPFARQQLPLVFPLSSRDTEESISTLVSRTSAAFANDSYQMCNSMISFPDPNNCPSLLNMGQRWGHYWVRWGDTFAEGFSLQRRKFHTIETWELSEHFLKMQHLEALERLLYSTMSKIYPNPSHLRRNDIQWRIIDASTWAFGHLPRPSSPSGCGSDGARLPGKAAMLERKKRRKIVST